LVSVAEYYVYSMLIAAFQLSCVPILRTHDSYWHDNTGFCDREWKVLYVIAPHRLPLVALCQLLETTWFLFAILVFVGDLRIKRCS
jgi:hypothetical protein